MIPHKLKTSLLIILLFVLTSNSFFSQFGPAWDSIKKVTEQDHQYMMGLLNITSLRPGVNGMDPNAPNAANYDESKANPYPNLPDPLVLKNGRKVDTPEIWWKERRPEIVEDFDREIYGRVPTKTPAVKWELISITKTMEGNIHVVSKKLVGHVDNSRCPSVQVDIQVTITLPADVSKPVPVIMEFGYVFPKGFKFPPPPMGSAGNDQPSWQQQVLNRGWGYAVYLPTSVQADYGAGLTQGIIGLMNGGKPRRPDDWGALRAWAWGASRVLDYMETDKSIDASHVGMEGHSRFGKAAAVAMAYDSRFAIVIYQFFGRGRSKTTQEKCR